MISSKTCTLKHNTNSTLVKYTEHITTKTIHARKPSNPQKLVRIIFTDPNATDSSSDDEPQQSSSSRRVKKYVHEINFKHAPKKLAKRTLPSLYSYRVRSKYNRMVYDKKNSIAYEKAAVNLNGANAVTNFPNAVKTETANIDGQRDKLTVNCLSSPTSVLLYKDVTAFDDAIYSDVDVFGVGIDVPSCLPDVKMPGKYLEDYDIGEFDFKFDDFLE